MLKLRTCQGAWHDARLVARAENARRLEKCIVESGLLDVWVGIRAWLGKVIKCGREVSCENKLLVSNMAKRC